MKSDELSGKREMKPNQHDRNLNAREGRRRCKLAKLDISSNCRTNQSSFNTCFPRALIIATIHFASLAQFHSLLSTLIYICLSPSAPTTFYFFFLLLLNIFILYYVSQHSSEMEKEKNKIKLSMLVREREEIPLKV
jgi:hypothetical protein